MSNPILPDVIIDHIHSFVDGAEWLSLRRVCRAWCTKLTGCIHLTFDPSEGGLHATHMIACVRPCVKLNKYISFQAMVDVDANNNNNNSDHHNNIVEQKRQDGREDEETLSSITSFSPMEIVPTIQFGYAMRIERENKLNFNFLDLSDQQTKFWGISTFDRRTDFYSFYRYLREADLTGLSRLQILSVRDCETLKFLWLPKCISSIDASGCRSLRRMYIPNQVKHLNLTKCYNLSSELIHLGLSCSKQLITISLDYWCRDTILEHLARSQSAMNTLQAVSLACSDDISDDIVTQFISMAPHVVRLNMEDCRTVSNECIESLLHVMEQRGGEYGPINDYEDLL